MQISTLASTLINKFPLTSWCIGHGSLGLVLLAVTAARENHFGTIIRTVYLKSTRFSASRNTTTNELEFLPQCGEGDNGEDTIFAL
jgi:hypothetical protein